MKKHYLLGYALLLTAVSHSQTPTVTDFESPVLAADTFNNGADLSGGFTYTGVYFPNYYDTTYFYNTGFSISNKTDVTTPGYLNQYSAITGSGFNSSNYAIYYPEAEISMAMAIPKLVLSARITNTTYAALSMLNGDAVGKKFGDTVNADGIVDGTNGEDYFILHLYGKTMAGDTTGHVEVVLADYRFADPTMDYVLQEWLEVDLFPLNSSVGTVDFIFFVFESSDVGAFGINTPTYFAMDDFTFDYGSVGLSELPSDFSVYPNPVKDQLFLQDAVGELTIVDAFGKTVHQAKVNGSATVDFAPFSNGMYFVRLENGGQVSTQKIVK